MTVTIENGQLIAKIAEKGAELQSLQSRDTSREYIWQADPEYWGKHAPILFPIVIAMKARNTSCLVMVLREIENLL